jgi:hypothetical protein
MKDRELNSIEEGDLASAVIGCWRFISAAVIEEFIRTSTTCVSPSSSAVRDRRHSNLAPVPIRARAAARAAQRGHFAILPSPPSSPSNQKR